MWFTLCDNCWEHNTMLKNELIEAIKGHSLPVIDASPFYVYKVTQTLTCSRHIVLFDLQRHANFDLWFLQSARFSTLYVFSAISTYGAFSNLPNRFRQRKIVKSAKHKCKVDITTCDWENVQFLRTWEELTLHDWTRDEYTDGKSCRPWHGWALGC